MPITGTVPITAPIAPTSEIATYPVTNPAYGLGGLRTVGTTTDRNAISALRREVGMVVYVSGENKYYHLVGGTANANWQEFVLGGGEGTTGATGATGERGATGFAGATGPQYAIQFNDDGQLSGASGLLFNSQTQTVVLGTDAKIAFGDGTTQGTARNFYSLTGATSPQFPIGVSGAGNTGDRLLIATGPSTDPFRNYVRFGKGWFQTGIVGIGQGPQGIQGTTGERGPTGEPGERGATGSFTGDFVSTLNGLTGSITITGGTNVSVNVTGSTITISASGGSAETTWGRTDPVTTTVGGVASGSTFDVATNAIAVLHKMLYPYQEVSFTSFLIGLGFVREFDLGTTSPANNYTASWSGQTPLANWVSESISISRTSPSSSTLLSGLSIGDSPRSIAHPTYSYTTPTALQFQISGQQVQGSNPRTAFDTYNWKARIYYGKSSKDTLNSSYSTYSSFAAEFPFTGLAGVFTSQNTVLGARTITWADTSPTGQHYWLFTPNVIPQFGQYVNFKDPNNLQVTPSITGNIVIANQNGLTMDYIYYRWGFPTEGIVTLTVS